jgi:L-asparagine transporter-like permease
MLEMVFLMALESSQQAGVYGLGSMMFGIVVQKFLCIE